MLTGSARALYGEYGQYVAEAAVNVPLSKTFAIRVAGNVDGQNGWQTNPYAGENQPRERNYAGRFSALWKPTDNLDITLKVEATSNKSETGEDIGNCPPSAPFVAAGTCSIALGLGIPLKGLYSTENTSGPGQGIKLTTFESVLSANYHIGDYSISSVTGFTKFNSLQNLDGDATPEALLNYQVGDNYHQFSQELRLTSPSDQTVNYMFGAYFQTDHTDGNPGTLSYYFLSPIIAAIPSYAALVPYLPIGQAPTFLQDEQVFSLFGSATWHVTPSLRLNGGLRASWDHKNSSLSAINGTVTSAFGDVVPFPSSVAATLDPLAASLIGTAASDSAAKTYHALMPSAGVQYDVAPEKMLYVSYARGFKAGVPVTSFSSGVAAPVAPEYVNAFELGFKTEWFNRRLQVNFDLFRSDYSDLQVAATVENAAGAYIFGTTNAASSRSQGAELEAQWAVDGHLKISASGTYLDSKFTNYANGPLSITQSYCRNNPKVSGCIALYPGGAPSTEDYSGVTTLFAPKWSGSVTPTYTTRIFGDFTLTGSLTAIFSTHFFFGNSTPDPVEVQKGYTRLDGRITLDLPGKNWSIDLIAKNMNNVYLYGGGNQGTGLPTSSGSLLVQREEPRNFSVQIRHKF